MKISACIITNNEEANLPRCLTSLKTAVDEIVIVDSGSTDRTKFIATDHNARFIPHDWEGYVAQKNFACGRASHDWILSIDADEELSPELQAALRALRERDPETLPSAFSVPRVVCFMERMIRFGDWYPDRLPRLFRKERGRFEGGSVHERLVVEGTVEPLDAELLHYTYRDWEDQRRRVEHYADLWARDRKAAGQTCPPWAPAAHGLWRTLRSFILKAGWTGGLLGLKLALAQGRETYLKYKALRAQPSADL